MKTINNIRSFQEHSIWWDEDLGIARAKAVGAIDEASANFILLETARIAQHYGGKIDWLINLSEMTQATSKARKILAEASAHPSIRKYALSGASVFIRTVANFISVAAGQKNALHFSTDEQALDWLQEDVV
ncbi:MAG: STAS/SEC14 domain-containing protein [Anaerolineales bacterium]|nr:STAS/SEC14 domain-containing protein [Chloroflexota bacterium]MBL6982874.1 STAS/SEC14 domain-containing protein [Anaerolineales bacterium]